MSHWGMYDAFMDRIAMKEEKNVTATRADSGESRERVIGIENEESSVLRSDRSRSIRGGYRV